MKKILNLVVCLCVCSVGFSQSITNQSSHIEYPRNITPYAIINVKTGDTVSWFWNRSEIQSYVNGLGLATSSSISSVHIYTYTGTPLYHISAVKYSVCITGDTGFYIKVLGTDSAGWFKAR